MHAFLDFYIVLGYHLHFILFPFKNSQCIYLLIRLHKVFQGSNFMLVIMLANQCHTRHKNSVWPSTNEMTYKLQTSRINLGAFPGSGHSPKASSLHPAMMELRSLPSAADCSLYVPLSWHAGTFVALNCHCNRAKGGCGLRSCSVLFGVQE